jgi:hypothetical protein
MYDDLFFSSIIILMEYSLRFLLKKREDYLVFLTNENLER